VAALAVAAVLAASASAAPANSITISGPRTATAGQRVKLRFTGYAATNVRRLRVWLDDRKCATTAKAEGARPDLRAPTTFQVKGDFDDSLKVDRSSTGTHLVCAYLLYQGTVATAARASWRYVTR
jgi:Tfp pilus assembly protein PilF